MHTELQVVRVLPLQQMLFQMETRIIKIKLLPSTRMVATTTPKRLHRVQARRQQERTDLAAMEQQHSQKIEIVIYRLPKLRSQHLRMETRTPTGPSAIT